MRAWEERDTNHMYSAMIFSVVSERLRLIKSESRAIFQNKERKLKLEGWSRERYYVLFGIREKWGGYWFCIGFIVRENEIKLFLNQMGKEYQILLLFLVKRSNSFLAESWTNSSRIQ